MVDLTLGRKLDPEVADERAVLLDLLPVEPEQRLGLVAEQLEDLGALHAPDPIRNRQSQPRSSPARSASTRLRLPVFAIADDR